MAFTFTLLLIFALPVTLLCAAMLAMLLDKPRGVMVRCRRCQYAMGGLPQNVPCPECGETMRVLTGRGELAQWSHLIMPIACAMIVTAVGWGVGSSSVIVGVFLGCVTGASMMLPAIICFHRLRGASLERRACLAVMVASALAATTTTGLLMLISHGSAGGSEEGMMVIFGPFLAQWLVLPASVVSLFVATRMHPASES